MNNIYEIACRTPLGEVSVVHRFIGRNTFDIQRKYDNFLMYEVISCEIKNTIILNDERYRRFFSEDTESIRKEIFKIYPELTDENLIEWYGPGVYIYEANFLQKKPPYLLRPIFLVGGTDYFWRNSSGNIFFLRQYNP